MNADLEIVKLIIRWKQYRAGDPGSDVKMTKKLPLDWVWVNSRLCTVQLNVSVRVGRSRRKHHYLFVVSVCQMITALLQAKGEFHEDLSGLLRSVYSTDLVVVAVYFTAHLDYS